MAPDKLGRGLRTRARGLERPKPVSRAPPGWLAAGLRAGAGGRGSATCRCSNRNWSEPSTLAEPQGAPPALRVGLGFHHGPLPPKNHPKEKTAFCSSGARREDRMGGAWGGRPGPAASGARRSSANPRQNPLPGAQGRLQAGARPRVGLALSPCCGRSHVWGASGDLSRGRSQLCPAPPRGGLPRPPAPRLRRPTFSQGRDLPWGPRRKP